MTDSAHPQAEPQLGPQQPSRTGHLNRHTCEAEPLALQGITDVRSRSSNRESSAYDPPDENARWTGGLTATPGQRPEILIWADNAHTRWQLTASRIDGVARTVPGRRGDRPEMAELRGGPRR
jgi:hypothetical protein